MKARTDTAEGARRRIAALSAIVEAMLQELLSGSGNGREEFERRLADDDALAMAVASELGDCALARALAPAGGGFASPAEELAANPVTPHLDAEQRERARVSLLAQEEADHAHTLAVRAPDRRDLPLTADARLRLAEEAFLGRLEIDVLHEREGWSGFVTTTLANTDERVAELPEPWRRHAARRLPEIGARVRETLERKRAGGPGDRH